MSLSQPGAARQPFTETTLEGVKGVSRRDFLAGTAGFLGALGLSGGGTLTGCTRGHLPSPHASGIEHIVLVMMENRSFDHFLGWLPNANGRQGGLTYTDSSGSPSSTHPLAPDYQGCGHPDPDHSATGGTVEYNGGRCDGWLRAGANDSYSLGYYTKADLPFFGAAATDWTVCSSYFASTMAATFPNRIYQHAAQMDRISNTADVSNLPTIWDRLASRGLTGRYYYSDIPLLALWGAKYLPISHPATQFFADCAAGTLPRVSFVDPQFMPDATGTMNADHPTNDIRNGEAFLNQVYTAITQGPNWPSTVLIINFDEWGGFFDHIPPPHGPIPDADRLAGDTEGLFGFRVPCLVISPWSRRGAVSSTTYDHTSVLRMIEWRWGLRPLTVRDATARNLASSLDFEHRNEAAPLYQVPAGPFGAACAPAPASSVSLQKWNALRNSALGSGWPIVG